MVTDSPMGISGNLPNRRQLSQLPVETPCRVDANSIQPTSVTDPPPGLVALMRSQINVRDLTMRALLDESREYIYHVAMMDPLAAAELDLRQVRALVDDLLAVLSDWLAAWCRSTKAA